MNNAAIQVLCCVAILCTVNGDIYCSHLSLRTRCQEIVNDNRQRLFNTAERLLSSDSLSMQQPLKIFALNLYEAILSNITITGLSLYDKASLNVLRNDIGAVEIPKIIMTGHIIIPALSYSANLKATLLDVLCVMNGRLSVSNERMIINDLQTNVYLDDIRKVEVDGNGFIINYFVKRYLQSHLKDEIENDENPIHKQFYTLFNDYVKEYINQEALPNLLIL